MVKKIIQVILVLIFIVLVVAGILVGSYVFSSPKTDLGSDSRLLITGAWENTDDDKRLEFDENGKFKYSEIKSENVIADGYYKIDEDRKLIKLFILPGHHSEAYDKCIKLFFFAQISYSDLKDNGIDIKKKYTLDKAPVCTFMIKTSDGSESEVIKMKMPEKTLDLYGKHKEFKAKNK